VLLSCHDQELTPKCLVKLWRQKALVKAEASRADPKERNVTVSMLNEGLGWLTSVSGCLRTLIRRKSEQQRVISNNVAGFWTTTTKLRGMTVYTEWSYTAIKECEVRGGGAEIAYGRIWGCSQKFSIPFDEYLGVISRWDIPVVFNEE
jgi:hypothetical protein